MNTTRIEMCAARQGRRTRGSALWAIVGAVLILCTASAAAGAIPVRTAAGTEAADPNLRLEDGVLYLSLEEAIATALERNLSLAVERFRRSESDYGLLQSQGIYDLGTRVDLSSGEETSPSASNLAGADVIESESQAWNLGLSKLVPSGGTAALALNNSRFETNSFFATLNPSFRIDFDVTFSQPLMRDAGRSITERGIRIARNNVEISRESFELQVIGVIQLVDQAYWNLVEAQAQLEVAKESLALAQKLHEQNKVRVEVGTLAPLELIQSEAGIATRKEEIIRAQAAVGDAEDRLRQLLNLNEPSIWAATIATQTGPEMTPIEINVEQGVAIALEGRAELRSKRLAQSNLEIDDEYFRNQAKPRLDLSLTYGYNGLGGDVTERDFFTGEILFEAPGDYGDALDQITNADFDGWSAALSFAYPIGNRVGRARRALAEVAVDRGAAELEDQELAVITEVRRLARFVETAAEARESARVSRRLAEENLDAEQKRYENGMSTSFQVLEIQEDLTQARSREVNTITGYRKALALYYQALGTLMQESGVEVVENDA